MKLTKDEIRMYSTNKNIAFEKEDNNLSALIGRLISIFINRLSMLLPTPNKVIFTERIVEYPIVFHLLSKDYKNILDFGCVEDLLPIHLASLGYRVTGLDQREYPFEHPNLDFINADILNWIPTEGKYDCAISVSTVEHVGLGGYGDTVSSDGDMIAVKKLLASLKVGGELIVTVPFGKHAIKRNMRMYNYQKLHELIPNITTERFFAKNGRYGVWKEVTWKDINELEYENYFSSSPCEAIALVVAKKI